MKKPVITEGHTDIEIGYFAGLFDGEGSIGIKKTKQEDIYYYGLRIAIKMLHQETVFSIFKCFGGGFGTYKKENGYHPEDGKYMSSWYCNGADANEILKLITPHLCEKKEQAELALDYIKTFGCGKAGPHRTEIDKQMQELYYLMMRQLKVENKNTSDKIDDIDDDEE